jgi:DegV family protein with EDD domain
MPSLCLLTDNYVQFIIPGFPGRSLVNILPQRFSYPFPKNQEPRLNDLPLSVFREEDNRYQTSLPSIEDFCREFLSLGQNYNEIIVLLSSSHITSMLETARKAADVVHGRISVQVVDSQTTSVGLGYLVQLAAKAASKNMTSTEIEQLLRGVIPHIYSIFCIPGLSYLYRSGFADHGQALAGEILGMLPIFSLEDGNLSSIAKVKNIHQLLIFFQEFLDEFSSLDHISFIQSVPPMIHESRIFREHAQTNFPGIPYSEHVINLSLASLLGPRSLGVVVIEKTEF